MTVFNLLFTIGLSAYMVPKLWRGAMTGVGPHGDEHVRAIGDLPLPQPISLRAFSVALLLALAFVWGIGAAHLASRGLHL